MEAGWKHRLALAASPSTMVCGVYVWRAYCGGVGVLASRRSGGDSDGGDLQSVEETIEMVEVRRGGH